jgi:hypothetical protein
MTNYIDTNYCKKNATIFGIISFNISISTIVMHRKDDNCQKIVLILFVVKAYYIKRILTRLYKIKISILIKK